MEDAAPAAVNAGEPRQRLPRSKSPVAPKVDRGKMMALFQAGWAVKDVAVEFSVSEPTVRKAFVDHTGLTVAEWRRMNGIVASNTFS
jgi:AraC-like DNA-binding protein